MTKTTGTSSIDWRAGALGLAMTALLATAQAAVVSINNGNPNAAQYYTSQAYAEIKSASPNYNLLDEGGRRANDAVPVGPTSESGHLTGGGSSLDYVTRATLDGLGLARAYASMSVTNAIGNGGYNAVASQGSRTQGVFTSGAGTPGRADFHFTLTGSASSPYGLALGRLDFLARSFVPGQGSYFDVFSGLHADTAGVHTFSYTGSFVNPLDLLFYAAAGVVIQDGATVPAGADFAATADFEHTFDLTSIDLFDANNRPIDSWTLTDMATGRVVFNQDGRVVVAVPEPTTLALVTLALTGLGLRRRQALG